MLGQWEDAGDPCTGEGKETTFRSQLTYILPAPGLPEGNFIFIGDRCVGEALEKSTYVWLPFTMHANEKMELKFYPAWDMHFFKK